VKKQQHTPAQQIETLAYQIVLQVPDREAILPVQEVNMKNNRIVLALAFALGAALGAGSALAGGSHSHGGGHYHGRVAIGVGIGFPYLGYGYGYGYGYPYYAPYAYYPPYYAPAYAPQPSAYVEQPQVQQAQQPSGYWYFCNDSRAYYPYVKECPAGWQRVAPQPQN
jgi:hypothetical protein